MERFEKQMAKFRADSQSRKVLQYMVEHGSISNVEAWFDLGIYRLASRIHDLRSMMIPIRTDIITITSEKGATNRYARYSIVESEDRA